MPNILQCPHHSCTKDEAAKLLGIKVYDTALPQPWLDEVSRHLVPITKDENTYYTLLSSIVWCYDNNSFSGYPHPLTLKAFGYLKAHDMEYDTRMANEYPYAFSVLDIA